MPTLEYSTEYIELMNKTKQLLADKFETEEIEIEELMAILELLADTETEEQLMTFIKLFSRSFPVLGELFEGDLPEVAEEGVDALVSKIMRDDPKLAGKVAKAGAEAGANVDGLLEKFPEIKKYLDK